ncbi:hypothetical protein SADUNF_Sadunf16G0016900 [Salix dunnii]|uniref:ER membrane protein complex subunit 3 n=1 Tax=Salix dunnii TaxID=1413687 RepID=A0A835MP24_9ROSI|nr:hypothetical protein SADUNF_Sadunf16G0016900 [Salix dunnii]
MLSSIRIENLKNPNLVLKFDSKLYCVEDEGWSKARRLPFPFSLSIENVEISGSSIGILRISDHRYYRYNFRFNLSTGFSNSLMLRNRERLCSPMMLTEESNLKPPLRRQAALATTPLIYSNKDTHIPSPSITNRPETRTKEQRLYISLTKDQNFVSDFGGVSPIKKSMAEDLVLDTAIRDWVLIPLTVVMILIGILRYFVSKLMQSQQTPDAKIVKEGQVVVRARNLRAGANFIPAKSFRARRAYFSNEVLIFFYFFLVCLVVGDWMLDLLIACGRFRYMENGLLHVPKGQGQNPQAQMFSDPNMAMDMMKKNLSMIIPQTLTFAWVNFFFSGFVAAKIPFPLTQRFRSMLQNGIDLSTVDVSYVSSRSWYFLNLFGLRGLFSLILGEENAMDDTQRMMQMGGFGFDPTKSGIFKTLSKGDDSLDVAPGQRNFLSTGPRFAMPLLWLLPPFRAVHCATLATLLLLRWSCYDTPMKWSLSLSAEKDGLDIIQHEWALPKFEQRAEAVLKKLVS